MHGDPTLALDTTAINAMWHPAGTAPVFDRSDFVVARITLSLDAEGSYSYVAFSNGIPKYWRGTVHGGDLGFPIPFPEPSGLALSVPVLVLAAICLVWRYAPMWRTGQ